MATKETTKETAGQPAAPAGERIAKVLSRAGIASRREAERMIELGEVAVNGKTIDSPALNVTPRDRITVRGEPLADAEPARLWLYYKPEGLVTSASDEKGRPTVFDNLPPDLPRVMSVGRLDLNSEGLLLLTNDGALKRRLELPSTGWLRKYRVRIKGNPTDPDLEPLRRGITVEGERFQPMAITLDRHQGANAWLTVGLREGKNREIRRALSAINLTVNRLIRVSYGPFRLGDLEPGQVEEVKAKTLREQLGEEPAEKPVGTAVRKTRAPRPGTPSEAPRAAQGTQRRTPAPADAKPALRRGAAKSAPTPALQQLSNSWTKATTPRQPAAAQPASPKPAGTKAAGTKTIREKPGGHTPTGNTSIGTKTASTKPSGTKAASAKPSGTKAASTEAIGTKRTGTKPSGTARPDRAPATTPRSASPRPAQPRTPKPRTPKPRG